MEKKELNDFVISYLKEWPTSEILHLKQGIDYAIANISPGSDKDQLLYLYDFSSELTSSILDFCNALYIEKRIPNMK